MFSEIMPAFLAFNIQPNDVLNDRPVAFVTTSFNIGSAYDPSTGKFTAPISGVYIFSAFLCVDSNKYLYYAVVKNNSVLLKGSLKEDTYRLCTSATVITTVEAGEAVWVKGTDNGSQYEIKQDQWRENTFSGALIRKIN